MKKQLLFTISALFLIACELENPSEGINVEDVVIVTSEKTSILADGIDNTIITATLGSQTDDNKEVTFTTDLGKFKGSSSDDLKSIKITSSQKKSEAILVSGNEEMQDAIIYAQIGDFSNYTRVSFVRAYPDEMTMAATKLAINKDGVDESEVTVHLYRQLGVPTTNALISFETQTLDSAMVQIVPFTYSNGTDAKVKLKSKNGYPGDVKIIATTNNQNGESIIRELTINIK